MKRNYDDPNYKKFRTEVLKRDKFKCRMPGCKSKKFTMYTTYQTWSNASALRYEPSNGITLCKKCHQSITGKESHYQLLFREIING